jgi:quinol monooxygenase YgiN
MINVVVTQRVNAGMEEAWEAIAREITANTLSQDQGCLRYEWYRADAPQTYILIERWTDQAAVQAHSANDRSDQDHSITSSATRSIVSRGQSLMKARQLEPFTRSGGSNRCQHFKTPCAA